jgi:hypothetical protein
MLSPHRKGKTVKAQPRASLEGAASEEDTSAAPMTVLPSSTDLFYFYGQSLEQCAKLSTGQPLFELCTLHKKWLRIYAGKWRFLSSEMIVGLLMCNFLEEVLTAGIKRYGPLTMLSG